MNEERVVSRRTAVRSIGVIGAVASGTLLTDGVADAAPEHLAANVTEPNVFATTIAEMKAQTAPSPDALYMVTDTGREGPFYYDPDDTTTAADDGIVFVGAGSHRYKRIFAGAIHIGWFGAVADYNPSDQTGTANDDALANALAALKRYAVRHQASGGFRDGLPPIEFGAGHYLFTRKQFTPTWYTAVRGLSLRGQGMYDTVVWFNCPEETNGADNYFLYNNNRLQVLSLEDIAFFGVTGTERFTYVFSRGTAGKTLASRCAWHNWQVAFDIVTARANADLNMFKFCKVRSMPAGSAFFKADNPQSVINSFVDCDMHSDGTLFDITAGGILTLYGGSYITFNEGCLLNVNDPEGNGVGIGNGNYLFNGIKPEIRQASQLVRLNAPEAHVTFQDCQLVIGQSNFATTWATGTSYAAGDRARVGATQPSLGRAFRCIQAHTGTDTNRPMTGDDWTQYWEPLYEIDVTAGAVHIKGGSFAYAANLRYDDTSYERARDRPELKLSDGCYLVTPLADAVDFTPVGEITNPASLPRASAVECQPYTGAATNAYWVTPTDPVNVTLNATHAFSGASVNRNTFVFRASPKAGEGLPSAADEPQTFLLPRGAHVLSVEIIADDPDAAGACRVTNHDGSVIFTPSRRYERASGGHLWYPIDSEAARTLIVTSTADARADGFISVEYV